MDEVSYAEFENPNFDAKELVQRYRKRIPLPHLQKSLRAHHATTRQELIELINEKYADFVSLSSRMQGVERALRPLRSPLEESCELTKGLQTKLGGLLQKAEETHERLGRIQARKEALHSYVENARLLGKVKASSDTKWGDSEAFFREHMAQEGVARELRRIRINLQGTIAAEGSDGSPECSALLEEAMTFQEAFSRRLQDKLRRLGTTASESWEAGRGETDGTAFSVSRAELGAIAQTSRALCTIGHGQRVEQIFAEAFAKVVLDEAVVACNTAAEEAKRKALAETSGGGSGRILGAGAVDLGAFVAVATRGLLKEGAPLQWFARRLRGGAPDADESLAVPSLRLVAFAAVLPALQKIQEAWPNVFMPAFPDLFAANYSHFSKFLQSAEEAMHPEEMEALRRDPALGEFQRKWKTQVYCSLRAKEANQRLDAAAKRLSADELGRLREAHGRQYWLETSSELLQTIHLVWGDWYLRCLYPKMARLALELVARYGKAMASLADGSGGSEGAGWDAGASPPAWSPTSQPAQLTRAAADILKVIEDLSASPSPGLIARLFLERLPAATDGQKPTELACALLADASEGLGPALAALKEVVLKQVIAAILPQFAAIRGIPAFYRMLNKPVPTKASPYVESAIRPLTAFQDVLVSAAMGGTAAASEWLSEIVDGASQEFTSQATQLIELTRQQEASLRRLGGRASGGEVSDLEKIHLQLCLDVDTFVGLASKPAANAPGLTKLTEAVAGIRRSEEGVDSPKP